MKIALQNSIFTDYYGFQQLIDFYHLCKEEKNKMILVDFSELEWIDANMCAFFEAIIYKLASDNALTFRAVGKEDFMERFSCLFRNGFLQSDVSLEEDKHKTTVPLKTFTPLQKDECMEYITNLLMQHRGMQKALAPGLKEQITDDLLEILANIQFHANSKDPFFLCGQYFPKTGVLVFTIVDLGVGFLPAVKIKTQGEINESIKAIRWALAGNTTKIDTCGGLGLRNIKLYCEKHKGKLHIISGDAYYDTGLIDTMWKGERKLSKEFVGTTINLYFSCN